MNSKTVIAMALAALVAGMLTYFVQNQKVDQLRAQVEAANTQLEQAKSDAVAVEQKSAAREKEIQKLQTNEAQLARARNEIAQLRQQRATPVPGSSGATANPNGKKPSAFPPGTYMKRDQLTFAGYGSPEATMQSLAWAAINGQFDVVPQTISPDMPQGEQFAQQLQRALQTAAPAFQGMQVMAEKSLAEDRKEVLVKVDVQRTPGGSEDLPPPYNVMTMVRVGDEWKLSAPPKDYSQDWQNTGPIKTFAQ